ncbi:VaFE repeat-containing surface-anchored protein, partial [Corynebacterium hesseae]
MVTVPWMKADAAEPTDFKPNMTLGGQVGKVVESNWGTLVWAGTPTKDMGGNKGNNVGWAFCIDSYALVPKDTGKLYDKSSASKLEINPDYRDAVIGLAIHQKAALAAGDKQAAVNDSVYISALAGAGNSDRMKAAKAITGSAPSYGQPNPSIPNFPGFTGNAEEFTKATGFEIVNDETPVFRKVFDVPSQPDEYFITIVIPGKNADGTAQRVMPPDQPGLPGGAKISTNADFAEGSTQVVAGAQVNDTVTYEGLVPGKEYTLNAELISEEDGKTVLGKGEKTFTPDAANGEVVVEITVDESVTEPVEAAVAFEELTSVEVDKDGKETPDNTSDNPIAEHKDIDDEAQTVTSKEEPSESTTPENPGESTTPENPGEEPSESTTPENPDESTTPENPDESTTPENPDESTTPKTSEPSESTTPENPDESTTPKTSEPSESTTPENPGESTTPKTTEKTTEPSESTTPGKPGDESGKPKISTNADFANGATEVVAGAQVNDTVEYENLVPGKEYTLFAELISKADGKTVLGEGQKTFTPKAAKGEVVVEITVDESVTEPVKAAVAFEELTSVEVNEDGEDTPGTDPENPNDIAEHKDINDKDQTVTSKEEPSESTTPENPDESTTPENPDESTTPENPDESTTPKTSEPSESTTPENPDESTTPKTSEPSESTTPENPGESTTPKTTEKTTEPSESTTPGKPGDESGKPKISTNADFANGATEVVAGAQVNDTVEYENLVPGKEYTLFAELISKADGKTVLGEGQKTFTPKAAKGEVVVEITVDESVTEPVKAAVAFEELTSVEVNEDGEDTPGTDPENPNDIAEHKDINDKDQTVTSKEEPSESTTPNKPGDETCESTTPSKPGEETTPNNPGESTTPGKPGESTTPGKPGESTTPNDPCESTTPDKPGEEPSESTTPKTTEKTTEPSESTTPNKPGDETCESTTPSKPGEETTPNNPGESTTPGKPGESTTPGKPGESTTPNDPCESTTPDKPGEEPSESTTPREPGDESGKPKISTNADFANGATQVVAGAQVNDRVTYENLVPGKEYTLFAELISKEDGKTVLGKG